MRDAIRQALKEALPELTEVYDPYVATKEVKKPYAVVVIGADTPNREPTNVSRKVEVWLYYPIGQLEKLDAATKKAIDALHYKKLINPATGKSFTASFEGVLGEDGQDEDWKVIYRGISLSFVSLYRHPDADSWEEALSDFIYQELGLETYAGQWSTDFSVPSVLVRLTDREVSSVGFGLVATNKRFQLHFAFLEGMKDAMEEVQMLLVRTFKVPFDRENNTYLTVEALRENTAAAALGVGQLTVELSRIDEEAPDYIQIHKIIRTERKIYE